MANPPFNVNRIDKAKLEGDKRYPFGLPRADNGNYIWIQIFYSALSDRCRAAFVMANSAADAGGSELDIRRKLIEDRCVDVIIAVGPNFFYTVTLPVTLWFLHKAVPRPAEGRTAMEPFPSAQRGHASEHVCCARPRCGR
jgi:type I restriction enzyme M protein